RLNRSGFIPSASAFDLKFGCKCGMILLKIAKKTAPNKKPTAAGSQAGVDLSLAISIAGSKSDQKLAAIMTPPAKPRMPSRHFWFIFFVVNTSAAPSAVMPQVNDVPKSACHAGCMDEKNATISIMFFTYRIKDFIKIAFMITQNQNSGD